MTQNATPPPAADAPPTVWRQLLSVEPAERVPLAWAGGYFFLVFASYYILRPIRDALGIAGGVDDLPWLFTATLVATLVVSPLFAALVARLPRRQFVTWSYRILAACLAAFFAALWLAGPAAEVWIGRAFYVFVSVFNLFVVSLFWGVMADTFRGAQARRLFAIIAAAGTLGAISGGAITRLFVDLVGSEALLLVSALLLEAALLCMRGLGRRAAADSPEQAAAEREVIGGSALAGIRSVLKSPYLLGICGYMLAYTLGSTFLYFMQAEIVAATLPDREARVAYFAQVDVLVNSFTLVIQLGLAAHVVRRIGVGWTLALLPAVSFAGFAALGVAPVLAGVLVFQVARRTVNFALARPAREMLFVPLAREDKFKAKNVTDVFVYRLGDQLGAWTSAGVGALGLGLAGLAWIAAPLSAAWLVLALWLGRRQAALADDRPPGTDRRQAAPAYITRR